MKHKYIRVKIYIYIYLSRAPTIQYLALFGTRLPPYLSGLRTIIPNSQMSHYYLAIIVQEILKHRYSFQGFGKVESSLASSTQLPSTLSHDGNVVKRGMFHFSQGILFSLVPVECSIHTHYWQTRKFWRDGSIVIFSSLMSLVEDELRCWCETL